MEGDSPRPVATFVPMPRLMLPSLVFQRFVLKYIQQEVRAMPSWQDCSGRELRNWQPGKLSSQARHALLFPQDRHFQLT